LVLYGKNNEQYKGHLTFCTVPHIVYAISVFAVKCVKRFLPELNAK